MNIGCSTSFLAILQCGRDARVIALFVSGIISCHKLCGHCIRTLKSNTHNAPQTCATNAFLLGMASFHKTSALKICTLRLRFTTPCPSMTTNDNVFPLISGGKVALNRLRPLPRFNATFPPILREKRYTFRFVLSLDERNL